MLHTFPLSIELAALPDKFTYPFHYTPHPLCILAAEEVQTYLKSRTDWQAELQQGKMFGVLIVRTQTDEIGFIAAFSGILAGINVHPYFVPPIYDLLQPEGFFKIEEENISTINAQIKQLENDEEYLKCRQQFAEETLQAQQELSQIKAYMKAAKETREIRRLNPLSERELAELIRESQFQKAELKRKERTWKEHLSEWQQKVDVYTQSIETLKAERKRRSAALQQQLFGQFRLLNAQGESKDLSVIFEQTAQKTPPAGAGECAAPKLLQYAYRHQLKPIAMAEFWWGNSPKAEIRHHGCFYPACKGKCEPILKHMLKGLEVEDNPLLCNAHSEKEPEIVYEDDSLLIIYKPEGMLSVPGKETTHSVFDWAKTHYPNATGPLIVHRLDMATSGLLLIAKTKEIHHHLQMQFKNRTIKKRYIALLDGNIPQEEGNIDLPLCLDPLDRPRQIVDETLGKPAITRYQVIERKKGRTLIAFYPETGRTHQLRVHAAHPLGLNCPIVGDELYGKKAQRLYLHAESLEFIHPLSGKMIRVEKRTEF